MFGNSTFTYKRRKKDCEDNNIGKKCVIGDKNNLLLVGLSLFADCNSDC